MHDLPRRRPEVWAGMECTVNRVGDRYFDQLSRTGHDRRPEDIDRLINLGVTAIRFPVLWERFCSDKPDWAWSDTRLSHLQKAGVRPILGLVHHGSGPPQTSLIAPDFPDGLAAFAQCVAERYPWTDAYTPVNEPLTTARFSGLYGVWYPHGKDDRTFVLALLNECRAVVRSMAAIREINPGAQLVQTEDLGQVHAPPRLAYQADFENHRRWLSWDLLCGRVDRSHPVWSYLRWVGIPEEEILWFQDNPCPPDILGVNHYLTSERYLDDRLENYSPDRHGGNGRDCYVDVEAVRTLPQGPAGPQDLLMQTWERYHLPIAVTEVHLHCTREEQLRWLREVWQAANAACAAGADIRAVTAWSAFGACDWDSLVTQERGHYEPGLFDVRGESPRPTALAQFVRQIAGGDEPEHPVFAVPGWWRRPERLFGVAPLAPPVRRGVRPLLITGANSALGRTAARLCRLRGLPAVRKSRGELDIADAAAVESALAEIRPWAVINAGGYGGLDSAETEPEVCRRENAIGPAVLAAVCAEQNIRLVTFSTDLVFDGRASRPYRESDAVSPLNVYGSTKAESEAAVLAALPEALVVRAGVLFGNRGGRDFVRAAIRSVASGRIYAATDDITVTACFLPDLIHSALDLLIDGASGICHIATPEPITWAGLARSAVELAGLDPGRVEGRPALSFGWRALRPAYTPLEAGQGGMLPRLSDCLLRFIGECRVAVAI
jgi:dTDP-4-dehydrorhamnose reductase